ncbi:MAG: RNase adaptor protein RapZ [Lentisphaerae bacterium GWF2_52_8]|nr:MAG: RNase adaptor protein RapZ [Lentisphaerae bacterium GWF2_52_8]
MKKVVIISGLSGAGKSTAIKCFEDLGFFCVDNLPAFFVPKFIDLIQHQTAKIERVALVIDIRSGEFLSGFSDCVEFMTRHSVDFDVIFLEASKEILINRFRETRRKHPLAASGSVSDGIKLERKRLFEIRSAANIVIDTTEVSHQGLKNLLSETYTPSRSKKLKVNVISFGYKYGLPAESDIVLDVRFLPNPNYVRKLQKLNGTDPRVAGYVLKWDQTKIFLGKIKDLFGFLIPRYIEEGKYYLNIAIGCTGGKHRSITIAEELKTFLQREFSSVSILVRHRDINK